MPCKVLEALREAVSETGTLVAPTFNYGRPPHFDVEETPAKTGALAELLRAAPGARRSAHPTHSVAAVGPAAEALTAGHGSAFGVGCLIDRLADAGGKVLLLGVGQRANSALHVAESHAGLPKRCRHGEPPPSVEVRGGGRPARRHALDGTPSCSAAFEAAAAVLRRAGLVRDARVGECLVQLVTPARAAIDAVAAALRRAAPHAAAVTDRHGRTARDAALAAATDRRRCCRLLRS